MRLVRRSAAIAALSLSILSAAHAQSEWLWIGPNNGADPASGDFNTATNWIDVPTGTINAVPGVFDFAEHYAAGGGNPYTVSSNTDNEIAEIIVSGNDVDNTADQVTYDWNGNVLNLNGGELFDQFGVQINTTVGNASLTLVDGEYNVYNSWGVFAGPGSTATLTVGAGAKVLSDFLGDQAEADFVGQGASSGVVNVINGGKTDSNQLLVAPDEGDVGVVNVSGAGSEMLAFKPGATAADSKGIGMGIDGSAEMNLSDGAFVKTQYMGIGGGFTATTGTGSATLNMDNATIVQESAFNTDGSGDVVIVGTDGIGAVNMTDSTFNMDFIMLIGGAGVAGADGEVNMDNSDMTNGQIRVAEDAGSTGSFNLSNGSTLVSSRDHYGFNGTGEITVTGGSTMTFVVDPIGFPTLPSGWVGLGSGGATSAGSMTVDGAGSVVTAQGATVSDAFLVGRNGTGVLTVSNGGLAQTTASDINIGRAASATGTINVQTGGIVRGQTGIRVGGQANTAGGSGTLNITAGGSIETPDLVIYAGDTVNVNTGGFGTIGTIGTVVNTANTLTVRTGGSIRGVGTINGNVANVTGGTIAPGTGAGGANIGLLTVNGSLNHGNCVAGAGGTLNMQINAAGTAGTNYDSMAVSGDVLLGGTLNLIVAGTYVPNGADQFNVITGTNNIVGAFESITNRVITPGIGGRVWGDYKENNAGPNADRYFVAPRRQADFNGIGGVSGADYTIWADNFGKTWATFGEGDANGDRQVTGADYTVWADNFGQTSIGDGEDAVGTYGYGVDMVYTSDIAVDDIDLTLEPKAIRYREMLGRGHANPVPEPSSIALGMLALLGLAGYSLRRRSA